MRVTSRRSRLRGTFAETARALASVPMISALFLPLTLESGRAQTADSAVEAQLEAAKEQRVLFESLVARGLMTREQADAINANAAKMQAETARLRPTPVNEVPGVPGANLGRSNPAAVGPWPSVLTPSVAAESRSAGSGAGGPDAATGASGGAGSADESDASSVPRRPQPRAVSAGGDTDASRKIAELSRQLDQERAASAAQQAHLIEALVARGVLTKTQASDLSSPSGMSPATAAQLAQAAQTDSAPVDTYKPVAGAVNVPYVPKYVREQIRDQVRQDLIAEAKSGKVSPLAAAPEWTDRIKISGDVRVRGEYDQFNKSNDPKILDVNALQSATYDPTGTAAPPYLNTLSDRDRVRLRARLGIDAQIDDDVVAFMRLTTGNTGTPTTQNQTLGNDFNKDSIVLDRAGFTFHPSDWVSLSAGRLPSPFFSTQLVWYKDLSYDGFDAVFDIPVADEASVFGMAGAFPLAFTDLNTPSNVTAENKPSNFNKWLLAVQAGVDFRPDPSVEIKSAAALYDFWNYQGNYDPTPCAIVTGQTINCPTDGSHPLFAQNGNSFFALRNFSSTVTGSTAEPQYFGLASRFDVLDLYTRVDWTVSDPLHLIVDLDYALNLGYSQRRLDMLANESVEFVGNRDSTGKPVSGNQAFAVQLTFGYPELNKLLDWNFGVGYKYLEPDSVVAAFNDPDFHLGGTNAKGYILTGGVGIAKNTSLNFSWFSASEELGQPYSVDVMQLDLNTRF